MIILQYPASSYNKDNDNINNLRYIIVKLVYMTILIPFTITITIFIIMNSIMKHV